MKSVSQVKSMLAVKTFKAITSFEQLEVKEVYIFTDLLHINFYRHAY